MTKEYKDIDVNIENKMWNIFKCDFSLLFCKKKKTEDPIKSVPFIPPITGGQVIKVYDGDTITIVAKLPYKDSPLYRFQIRLLGIDSPEIKGRSEEEKAAARVSQKALETLILHKTVFLENNALEKYGRILANVYIMIDGKRIWINEWLLNNNYAVPYDGKTKIPFTPLFESQI
jgi:endonuclease YncB( thermonuclease family)